MSDKFSVDDILAEFSEEKNTDNTERTSPAKPAKQSAQTPGATMILRSIDEKKNTDNSKSDTKEIIQQKPKAANADAKIKSGGAEQKSGTDKSDVRKTTYKGLAEFEEKNTPAKNKTVRPTAAKEAESKPHTVNKTADIERAKKHIASSASQPTANKQSTVKPVHKHEQSKVSINTSANMSFTEKIRQYKFLFEELTKRDFKKKYKRTFLGVLWSVISPFMTFLVQFFVFGYIFNRLDSGFVVYLLSGTLMYSFFTNATTAGMFSMYSNGGILSKINVPKFLFVLSSNSASIFNFLLTLVVYFVFMIFCHISFGVHLIAIIFPIVCLIIFNIGMSYILSSLFVFFRDMQYLYQIFTTLLMYMSAIFYDIRRFPENLRFVFDINPIYHYISYLRQVVIDATVPDLTTHLICLAFSFGMLGVGYLVHKKTEQKFVYYY